VNVNGLARSRRPKNREQAQPIGTPDVSTAWGGQVQVVPGIALRCAPAIGVTTVYWRQLSEVANSDHY